MWCIMFKSQIVWDFPLFLLLMLSLKATQWQYFGHNSSKFKFMGSVGKEQQPMCHGSDVKFCIGEAIIGTYCKSYDMG